MATTGHIGKSQTDDTLCAQCHKAADNQADHQTENVTAHNPTIAAGLKTFTYEVLSAAVDATSNDVTIKFKISADGTPVTYRAPAAAMADPLTGFTGSPGFLLAYATAQDGVAAPIDYNNTGVKQAQAVSVSIANLLDTTKTADGSLSAAADANGYYTATLKGTGTKKFPVGAKLRAVGLQGYFTQNALATGGVATARHAISVVKAVTGDAVRRTVVDPAKCSSCHEWFEGHGGNRVYQTQVCVMCHTPGLATSGRGMSDAALMAYPFTAADVKILGYWNFDKTLPNAALNLPVVTNDFKDMIHGIHAGRERVTPFVDARDRTPSAITLLDFKRMDFPGKLNACETCHMTGTAAATTYNTVPAGALASTYESVNAAYAATPTPANAKLALNTANPEDKVTTPFAAACVSCHDSALAQGHMSREGGQIKVSRSAMNLAGEGCALCHGAGTDFDPVKVHK
jgi:OmcA/MtrC family decaheme c-type cytochrome